MRLLLGDLDLNADPFLVSGDGFSWGKPEPIVVAIESALFDGSLVETESYGNRTVTLTVMATGRDFADLAELERLLVLETGKRNTLTRDGTAPEEPPTVYEVETSDLEPVANDVDEALHLRRQYTLTLTCRPFVRSATKVSTPITLATGTPLTIDNGDSAAGWSSPDGAVTSQTAVFNTAPGALQFTVPRGQSGFYSTRLVKAGTVDLTGRGVIRLALNAPPNAVVSRSQCHIFAVVNGTRRTLATGCTVSASGAFVVLDFVIESATALTTVTSFEVEPVFQWQPPAGSAYPASFTARMDTVQAYAVGGAPGKQFTFAPEVRGSTRTPAVIRLRHQSNALGETIVYTFRDRGNGYVPSMAAYRTDTTTANSDAISGRIGPAAAGGSWTIPTRLLEPGQYAVMSSAIAGDSTNAATVRVDGVTVASKAVPGTGTALGLLDLGVVYLPGRMAHPSSQGTTTVAVTLNGGTSRVDDLLLFRMDDAELTWANITTRQLWINPPSPTEPTGAIWRGSADDYSDAAAPATIRRLGRHQFRPRETTVHFVTSGTAGTAGTLEYFPTGHTHAPE